MAVRVKVFFIDFSFFTYYEGVFILLVYDKQS